MQKAHSNIEWENYPSIDTPINEQNLNKMDKSIDEIDNRVIALDTAKLSVADAQGLVKSLSFNQANGVFTITYYNGSTATIDTMLEKIAVNFDFDENAQQLVITLDDGTEKRVDLSAFIKPIEFIDSGTIAWQLLDNGRVSAIVKEGSIEEKHLQPNYLADVKVEVAKAEQSATQSAQSAQQSDDFSKLSESFAHGGTGVRDGEETDSSMYWSQQSKASADTAAGYIEKVEKAGEDAVQAIQDALDMDAPEFMVDLATGRLMYSGGRFVFNVNKNNGHLEWGLAV